MAQVTSGIAELIARIKQDGVQEGEQERERLVAAARTEAEQVLAKARAEAAKIRAEADADAADRRKRLDAELKMAARDFVFRFQERLRAQAIAPATEAAVTAATQDPAALARLIEGLVSAWGQGGGAVTAHVAPADKSALEAALSARITAGELTLVDDAGVAGFKLVRSGEHFAWDFTTEAIARELARLVEPGLRDALSFDHAAAQG